MQWMHNGCTMDAQWVFGVPCIYGIYNNMHTTHTLRIRLEPSIHLGLAPFLEGFAVIKITEKT